MIDKKEHSPNKNALFLSEIIIISLENVFGLIKF
jgi:hypothetical protein